MLSYKYKIEKDMRLPICLFIIIFNVYSPVSHAQNLLNYPESAVYDSLYNRYLVSNWADGSIVQIDSNGIHDHFTTGHGSINGITISGNAVFAGCSTHVKGFGLDSSLLVMNLAIPGAINLNDVAADNSGNLYITDFDTKKIIKVNIQNQTYSTFVNYLSRSPNGILFDESNNRLLLCSFGYNIPILAISLIDSTVSIVANTSLAQCDGFTKDDYGNYYISSWATNSIHKFDSTFSNPPELFYTNSQASVDISYNSVDDLVIAPIMYLNTLVYLPVNPNSVNEREVSILQDFKLFQNFPNPFNPITTIKYNLDKPTNVVLKIFDVLGKKIRTLVNENQVHGLKSIEWDGMDDSGFIVSNGIYVYQIQADNQIHSKKMLFLK